MSHAGTIINGLVSLDDAANQINGPADVSYRRCNSRRVLMTSDDDDDFPPRQWSRLRQILTDGIAVRPVIRVNLLED